MTEETPRAAARRPVGAAGRAAVTAPAASRSPAPQLDRLQPLPAGKGRAEPCSAARTCAGVSAGFTENISAATPETWGADMLVPW